MDSGVERQAIRTAIAMAAASSHGKTPDVVSDLREQATMLIALCVRSPESPDIVRAWCDDASAMLNLCNTDDALPHQQFLMASAAVLRLRLSAVRVQVKTTSSPAPKKQNTPTVPRPMPNVGVNQKKVLLFVREHPDVRTKDLLQGMSSLLSERSVKRFLKELVDAGLIHRSEQSDGSVSYRVDAVA